MPCDRTSPEIWRILRGRVGHWLGLCPPVDLFECEKEPGVVLVLVIRRKGSVRFLFGQNWREGLQLYPDGRAFQSRCNCIRHNAIWLVAVRRNILGGGRPSCHSAFLKSVHHDGRRCVGKWIRI